MVRNGETSLVNHVCLSLFKSVSSFLFHHFGLSWIMMTSTHGKPSQIGYGTRLRLPCFNVSAGDLFAHPVFGPSESSLPSWNPDINSNQQLQNHRNNFWLQLSLIFKYIYILNNIFIFPYLPIFFHLPYIPSERSSDFRNLVCFRSSSKTFRNSSLCVLAFRNRADTLCSQGSWWWMVSTWGFYGDVMGIYPNISKNHADVMQIRWTMIFSHEKNNDHIWQKLFEQPLRRKKYWFVTSLFLDIYLLLISIYPVISHS